MEEPLTTELQKAKEYNHEYKLKTKTYADITGHRKVSETKAGDKVLLKNLRPKKHEPVFSTDTYTILRRKGNHVEVERDIDEKKYIRPLSLIKKIDCRAFRDNVLNFKPDHDLVPSSGDLVSRSSSGDVEPVQSENVTHDNPVCENGLQNKPVVSAPESEPIVVRRGEAA